MMSMWIVSVAAISGPEREAMTPVGMLGEMWMAKAADGAGAKSSMPSSIAWRAPA